MFAPRFPGASPDAPRVVRYPSLPAATYPEFALAVPYSRRIARLVRRLEVDVLHAHHPFLLGPAAARLARRLGRPLVFTYHTRYEKYAHYVPLSRRLVERAAVWLSTRFADRCDMVIAPSALHPRRVAGAGRAGSDRRRAHGRRSRALPARRSRGGAAGARPRARRRAAPLRGPTRPREERGSRPPRLRSRGQHRARRAPGARRAGHRRRSPARRGPQSRRGLAHHLPGGAAGTTRWPNAIARPTPSSSPPRPRPRASCWPRPPRAASPPWP